MSVVFGFLAPLLVLALLGLVAAGVVGFLRGRLTLATIIHAYTALMLGVCLVLMLSGGALLLKTLTSTIISRDFSYQAVDYPYGAPPGVVKPPQPSAAERADAQAADDLTAGITLLILGGGLGVIHAVGKAVSARRDTDYTGPIERGYAVAMLLVGTAVGLTSSALLLNDLLRRYVVTTTAPTAYTQPHPGGALGFALLFVPLWVYFAHRVWRMLADASPARGPGALPPASAPPLTH
jgi:hypothetical protein